jgi:hypothetical protein
MDIGGVMIRNFDTSVTKYVLIQNYSAGIEDEGYLEESRCIYVVGPCFDESRMKPRGDHLHQGQPRSHARSLSGPSASS